MKDIKVKFLIDETQKNNLDKIRIFFKDICDNDIQIDLRPGETVYSQTNYMSNSLKIYSRKGIISIQEQEKPYFLNYYIGYTEDNIDNQYFLFNLTKELRKPKTEIIPLSSKQKIINETIENTFDPTKDVKETIKIPLLDETELTPLQKALNNVKEYSKKKKPKSKKGPGRPKKRGPKKGSKNKKKEE